jgi:uncharacterized membrane protein YeaQ/YmgE (transglycosylase-associated protein family)
VAFTALQEATVLGFILYLMLIGLIAGFLARALVPGRDPMSVGGTMLLGIVGSFVGGFLGYLLTNHRINDGALHASGLIGSVLGSIVALLVYRAATGRRHII